MFRPSCKTIASFFFTIKCHYFYFLFYTIDWQFQSSGFGEAWNWQIYLFRPLLQDEDSSLYLQDKGLVLTFINSTEPIKKLFISSFIHFPSTFLGEACSDNRPKIPAPTGFPAVSMFPRYLNSSRRSKFSFPIANLTLLQKRTMAMDWRYF